MREEGERRSEGRTGCEVRVVRWAVGDSRYESQSGQPTASKDQARPHVSEQGSS